MITVTNDTILPRIQNLRALHMGLSSRYLVLSFPSHSPSSFLPARFLLLVVRYPAENVAGSIEPAMCRWQLESLSRDTGVVVTVVFHFSGC